MEYTINKHIATISKENNIELQLNIVTWNNREPKLDFRRWRITDATVTPLKGLTLSENELEALIDNIVKVGEICHNADAVNDVKM